MWSQEGAMWSERYVGRRARRLLPLNYLPRCSSQSDMCRAKQLGKRLGSGVVVRPGVSRTILMDGSLDRGYYTLGSSSLYDHLYRPVLECHALRRQYALARAVLGVFHVAERYYRWSAPGGRACMLSTMAGQALVHEQATSLGRPVARQVALAAASSSVSGPGWLIKTDGGLKLWSFGPPTQPGPRGE